MHTITVFLTDSTFQVYEESYATRREAQARARAYVSRDGLTSYRRERRASGATRYFHSEGERIALVLAQPTEDA